VNETLPLATTPQYVGRGRRCGIWVSPWARDTIILDTRALKDDDWLHAGRDTFPADCVLVIVNPEENHRLTEFAAQLRYPIGGPLIAEHIITERCCHDRDLAKRIGWFQKDYP
jgi:hypothetical protein